MFFFFNDTATTEIYTLSLHDALPIFRDGHGRLPKADLEESKQRGRRKRRPPILTITSARSDRKSTRLNSSHLVISYAVFCLKKKKRKTCPAGRRPASRSFPLRERGPA